MQETVQQEQNQTPIIPSKGNWFSRHKVVWITLIIALFIGLASIAYVWKVDSTVLCCQGVLPNRHSENDYTYKWMGGIEQSPNGNLITDGKLIRVSRGGKEEILINSFREKTGKFLTKFSFPKGGGQFLYFGDNIACPCKLYSYRITTGELKEMSISADFGRMYNYSISPDGNKIAAFGPGQSELYIFNLVTDTKKTVYKASAGISLFCYCDPTFKKLRWLDNSSIEFPIYRVIDAEENEFLEEIQIEVS